MAHCDQNIIVYLFNEMSKMPASDTASCEYLRH